MQIEGEIFHELEEMGGETFAHIGFRDDDNQFGDLLAQFVPEVGMRRRARLTIELLDNDDADTVENH